jgi:hypothetical protein
MPVYIVIQNGESYPNAYNTYNLAVEHVKLRNADMLKEANECNVINVVENPAGKTYLYIEKGIHIYILRLQVIYTS